MTFINSTETLANFTGTAQTVVLAGGDSWMTIENPPIPTPADPLKVIIAGIDTNITMADTAGNMIFELKNQGAYALSVAPRGGTIVTTSAGSEFYVMGTSADNLAIHIRSI
jgi:hypothetical protein